MTLVRAATIALTSGSLVFAGCAARVGPPDSSAATIPSQSVSLPPDSPALKQIRREPVATAELATDEIIAPGKVEANPNRLSKISLPVAGRIAAVLVKVGDAVRQGEPLLTIDSPDADAAMSTDLQADATVLQARAALAKARADADRVTNLFEHNAVAKKEVVNADSALVQARAALSQAEALREQAQRRLTLLGLSREDFQPRVVVRAPLAGKVLELSVVPGEFRNDTSATLMTIADLSIVWVSSQVPETDIRLIQPHGQVQVSLIAYPGETFLARVLRIADTLDPQTRTVKVLAEMPNPAGRFRPEMFGSIHHVESTTRGPVVPAGAVMESDGQSVVVVEVSPGHFEQRAVVIGKQMGNVIGIVSGLQAGEIVVVDGAMLLRSLLRGPA